MTSTVPEEILKNTTKCRNDQRCLELDQSNAMPMCEVAYAFGNNLMFIKHLNSTYCPYQIAFGDRHICTCPTHYAIYSSLKKK
jgi:hypothetical protein